VNTLVSAIACLVVVCLLPLTAGAAEGEVLFSTWTPLLLVAAVVALCAVVLVLWLHCRRQAWDKRQARDQNELAIRLRLADQTLDQAPFPILRLDIGLRVVTANQSARKMYTPAHASLIGRGLLDLLPELAGHPDIIAWKTGTPEQQTSPDIAAPERKQRDTGALGKLVTVADRGQSQFFWFGTVTTGQERVQAPVPVESPAEESTKRTKSEFFANINHEVRTPLNAIIGYTEMLANSQLGAKEKRFVSIIHKSSMALVSIFNDIMEISKIDSDRIQIMITSVRLRSIVDDVDGLFKNLVEEKGILFSCRVAGHLPQYILFDGVRLKQILQNMVGNAVKFTNRGTVSLGVDGVPSATKPGCLDLSMVIEDTGIGISEVDQRRIVDLFSQGQDDTKHFGGVGLGLTLCSRLMAMMGGRIKLVSKERVGTTFTLLFDGVQVAESIPAAQEVPAGEQPLPAGQAPLPRGQKKLLVVDDIDLIKDFFLDFFQDSPYRVFTANSSAEAMTTAQNERPDLIFMDLNLTGSDGREATRQLRAHPATASIPVVVMTGHILAETDYRPLFDDFLQKPFRLEKLQNVIDRYVPVTTEAGLPESGADSGKSEDEQILALLDSDVWNAELESLRQQAAFSGSLTDAAALGTYMRQRGLAEKQPLLSRLGEELLQHAQDPDISGIDRLLAKLSQKGARSEP